MKRILSLLAVCAMLAALLTGCGSGTEVEYYDTEPAETAETAAPEATEAPAEETPAGISIMTGGLGYEAFAPDTVVGTVDGTDVTWMEYFYWLNYYTNYYVQTAASQGIALTSWDAVGELSGTNSNGGALVAMTQYTVRQYHSVLVQAELSGVSLSDEDEAALESVYNSNCDTDGDGEVTDEEIAAFDEYLTSQHVDRDFFMYLNRVALLSDRLFGYYYGDHGEKCPDELVYDYIHDNGVMYAKHILLLTVDSATRQPLDEETVASKRETIDRLYADLEPLKEDKEALNTLFDQYMAEYTEDTGYAANPNGYLFVPGDMVQEFETAVQGLDENSGLSEVVESPYGYHIILRMPVTPENVVGKDAAGADVDLRYVTAEQQFSMMLSAWTESAEVVWNEGFESPDMAAIFG